MEKKESKDLKKKPENKEPQIKGETVFFIILGVSSVLGWFFLPKIMNWYFPVDYNFEMKGKFGDMYNVTTSLFGALTIGLLLYNLYLTKKELSESRKEFKIQNRTLKYQRFENTFFHLIKLNLKVSSKYLDKNGITKFDAFRKLNQSSSIFSHFENEIIKDVLQKNSYSAMAEEYRTKYLSHVYRTFMQYLNNFNVIVDFIISNKTNVDVREKYFKIYVAQLSNYEKKFLYYHFALTEQPLFWNELSPILFSGLLTTHFYEFSKTRIIETEVQFLPDEFHIADIN